MLQCILRHLLYKYHATNHGPLSLSFAYFSNTMPNTIPNRHLEQTVHLPRQASSFSPSSPLFPATHNSLLHLLTSPLQTESVASAVGALRLASAELCTAREWDGTCESDSGNGEEGEDWETHFEVSYGEFLGCIWDCGWVCAIVFCISFIFYVFWLVDLTQLCVTMVHRGSLAYFSLFWIVKERHRTSRHLGIYRSWRQDGDSHGSTVIVSCRKLFTEKLLSKTLFTGLESSFSCAWIIIEPRLAICLSVRRSVNEFVNIQRSATYSRIRHVN